MMPARIAIVCLLLTLFACGTEDDPTRDSSPSALVNTLFLLELELSKYEARGLPQADATGHIEFNRFIELDMLDYTDLHGYAMEFYRCEPDSLVIGQGAAAICIMLDIPAASACHVELNIDNSDYSTGRGRSSAAYVDFSDCATHEGIADYSYMLFKPLLQD